MAERLELETPLCPGPLGIADVPGEHPGRIAGDHKRRRLPFPVLALVAANEGRPESRAVGVNPLGALELSTEPGRHIDVADQLPDPRWWGRDIDLDSDPRASGEARLPVERALVGIPPAVEPGDRRRRTPHRGLEIGADGPR